MGYTHFEAAKKLKLGKVVAVSSRNRKKLSGDWRGIQGNFGPPAGKVDLSRIATHKNYRRLLEDPKIDMVDICLPTALHEKVTLEALKAGKHVFVEKPITIESASAKKMVVAARKSNRLLMVGHVLPFFPEFRYLRELVTSGRHGALRAAHFRRVIAPPKWSQNMSDYRKLGGWGIDLHIHDNHFIRVLCGCPKKIFSRGIVEDGLVNHVHTQYLYDDPSFALSCVSGGIAAAKLEFAHGFELYFEKATVLFNAGTIGSEWIVERPLTLITDRGKPRQPKLKGGNEWCAAFTSELQTAVDGVIAGKVPDLLSGELAWDALKICHAEAKSIVSGRVVRVS